MMLTSLSVRERGTQHRNRLCHWTYALAHVETAPIAQPAAHRSHDRLRTGRLVQLSTSSKASPPDRHTNIDPSTCVVSILRLQSLYRISRATDVTWENPLAAIWSCVEINTGILCSCIPTLKAAASRIFPRLLGGSRSSSITHSDRTHSGRRPTPLGGLKRRSKIGFEALGRGLSGKSEPTQSSTISGSGKSADMSRSEDMEMSIIRQTGGRSLEWERQIQVVTTLEQDVQDIGDARSRVGSDGDSQRELVS